MTEKKGKHTVKINDNVTVQYYKFISSFVHSTNITSNIFSVPVIMLIIKNENRNSTQQDL